MEESNTDTSNLSRAARKKLKRQQREEEQHKREERLAVKQKNKKIVKWSIVTVMGIGVIAFFVYIFAGAKVTPYSGGQVHWHARINVFICGEKYTMPAPASNAHLGKPLLHTHDDKLIHVEGTIYTPEEITLGEYMKAIGLTFKDDRLLDKKNGALCKGNPGRVKLFVNGDENKALTSYIIKDDEEYELRFE